MKKLLLLSLLALPLLFTSCEKDDDDNSRNGSTSETNCWIFTITQVTSISGASVPGYPETIRTKIEQCGLTEKQANEMCERLTTTTSSSMGGYKITVKITATKRKK